MSSQPWTFVVSEYLDLPFLMRTAGVPVISARSAREALESLRHCQPPRVVVDPGCYGIDGVLAFLRERYPNTAVEFADPVVDLLLAS